MKNGTVVRDLLGLVNKAQTLVHCAEPECAESTPAPASNEWAFGRTQVERFCPAHSVGAKPVPNQHALSAPEQFSVEMGGRDANEFLGLSLMGNMQIVSTPQGFVIVLQGPMPPILRALKQTSRLLGPDGQPQVEQMPLALPPTIRLVLPRTMLTEEAVEALNKNEATPARVKIVAPTAPAQ